jgi:rhodanese-related sulfurtransferase
MPTVVCKAFEYSLGRTGLTEREAHEAGMDIITALCPGPDREHFAPGASDLLLKLVVEKASRRLLGVQAVGPGLVDKRIDVASMAILAGMTVDRIANADLGYSPPFSPVLDNIMTAANVARNKLDGLFEGIDPIQFHELFSRKDKSVLVLDVRSPAEQRTLKMQNAHLMPLGSLRSRINELPSDKLIVTVCNYGLRAYEAAVILKQHGLDQVKVLDGGLSMWPYELDIP